jgi:hypothetical protein
MLPFINYMAFTNTRATLYIAQTAEWYDTGPKELLCDVMNCIHFIPEIFHWRNLINTLMNFRCHEM